MIRACMLVFVLYCLYNAGHCILFTISYFSVYPLKRIEWPLPTKCAVKTRFLLLLLLLSLCLLLLFVGLQ